MTTTLERFYTMNGIGFGDTYFETNGDLGVYLSRGGEDTARYADGGIALVMLDVDDSHSVVSVDTRGSRPEHQGAQRGHCTHDDRTGRVAAVGRRSLMLSASPNLGT